MTAPTMAHRLAAEFIGTFWLVLGGCGAAVFAANPAGDNSVGIGYLGVALAFGLTVLTGVCAFGTISGGHFNPAVSVGLVDGQPLLDLDYSEDSRAEVDLNVVMDGEQRLLELQGTAEGAPFSREALDRLLNLADGGIRTLQEAQRQALATLPQPAAT